MIQIPRWFNFC